MTLEVALRKATAPPSLQADPNLDTIPTDSARIPNDPEVQEVKVPAEDARATERTVADASAPAKIPTINAPASYELSEDNALKVPEKPKNYLATNKLYSMNYTEFGTTPRTDEEEEEEYKSSRNSSLDSNIDESDTVE